VVIWTTARLLDQETRRPLFSKLRFLIKVWRTVSSAGSTIVINVSDGTIASSNTVSKIRRRFVRLRDMYDVVIDCLDRNRTLIAHLFE